MAYVPMKINGRIVDDVEFSFSEEDGSYEDAFGNMAHRVNGAPHRIGLPALEYANGQKEFWRYGVRHRDPKEGPAVVFPNGNGDYWVHGRRLKETCQKLLKVRYLSWIYFWFYYQKERQFHVPKKSVQGVLRSDNH